MAAAAIDPAPILEPESEGSLLGTDDAPPSEYAAPIDRAAWWNGYGEGLAAAELTQLAREADEAAQLAAQRSAVRRSFVSALAVGFGWFLGSLVGEAREAARS